ncbi:MAG: hypothetical protein ACRCZH_03315 [Cetobacterium sp.]
MAEKFKWVVYVDGGIRPDREGKPAHWKFEFDEFHRKTDAEEYARNLRKKFKNVVMESMNLPDPTKI